MTGDQDLEARLERIDAELDELSSKSSGFKLAAELRRLRRALFSSDDTPSRSPPDRFASERDRVERIRTLQRERERVLEALSTDEHADRNESQPAHDLDHPDSR